MNDMTSSIELAPQQRGFSLSPQTLDEAMQFAGMMSKSNIVPKDYQGNPGNILVAIQWGAEIGLAPLQAMQSIAVINGRPSIWGDAMLALVRGSGLLDFIREEPGENGCTCTIKRRGEPFEVERVFTVEDAKKAGLWGKSGPWQQHPKRMMQMRARAFALRDVFPDVLRGVHVAEEAQDISAERHMGQADEVKAEPALPAPPPSRGDRARDALRKRHAGQAAALPPPALADVMTSISQAATLQALKASTELARALADDDAKSQARAAYAQRQAELSGFDEAAYADKLRACSSRETLAIMADDLREIDDDEARGRLMAVWEECDSKLGGE